MNWALIKDGFVFISGLSPQRLWNGALVMISYLWAKISKTPSMWAHPISISVEPTTSCNLRCPQCPSGLRSFSRPTGMLQGDLYQGLIDSIYKKTSYLTLYFQGEPYLNPDFLDMVKYARSKNMYVATSSNAHYLNLENSIKTIESGLNRLIISIDGITQETYAKYRIGGKLDKVFEATKNLMEARKITGKKGPLIIWQFIVFSHNEHELPEIKKIAKEFGVDYLQIKTAQVYDYETGNDLIPKNEKYARYKKDENQYAIKNKLLNHCWRLWHSCVVTWDGLIVPCCFDKDASHQLGDLKLSSFNHIWWGKKYIDFRSTILKGRANIDICKNCTEGTTVFAN